MSERPETASRSVHGLPVMQSGIADNREAIWKVSTNAVWKMSETVMRLIIAGLVGILITRYLGPQQFGLFSYCLAFATLFASFSHLGMNQIVVRMLNSGRVSTAEVLGSALFLRSVGAVILWFVTFLTISMVRYEDETVRYFVSILAFISFFQVTDVIELFFQAGMLARRTAVARNLALIVSALFRVAALSLGLPLEAFVWLTLFEYALSAAALWISYSFVSTAVGRLRITSPVLRDLMRESWPLLLSGVAVAVYLRIDQLMIGELIDDNAVGIYAAASRLSEIWYFFPTAMLASIAPVLNRDWVESKARYFLRLVWLSRLFLVSSFAIATVFSLVSTPVIRFLYGAEFAKAAPILAIHIWASIFVFVGNSISNWYVNTGLQRLSLLRTATGALLNTALNFFLIPQLGGVGAAISTVLSYGWTYFLSNLIDKRTRFLCLIQLGIYSRGAESNHREELV